MALLSFHDLPRVALVGRRNVGKSSLLNALSRKRLAITDDTPGLTRDVLDVQLKHKGCSFLLQDTPGLDVKDIDELGSKAVEQAKQHLSHANLILFILEAPLPYPFDLDFIPLIRKTSHKIPILFIVNKVDDEKGEDAILLPFYEVNLQPLLAVSARGRRNLNLLLDRVVEKLSQSILPKTGRAFQKKDDGKVDEQKNEIRLAIVGRANAGKSSLFNCMIEEERSLVSEIPGTTRDTVDSLFSYKTNHFRIVDTAGMQRYKRLVGSSHRVAFYSFSRSVRAIKDADVVVQLIDGVSGLTDFDKRIYSTIQKHKRPSFLLVSKWDLLKKDADPQVVLKNFKSRLEYLFPYSRHLPLLFSSAMTSHGIGKIFEMALQLHTNMNMHIPTAELNTCVNQWSRGLPRNAANLKVLYAAQVATSPPSFVFFVNNPQLFTSSLYSYFENCIREKYDFHGIPLPLYVRQRS